jgi:large subunit ribosomal protein L13
MKTFALKKENVDRQWFVIDASDKILGRIATKIADRIRGKDKPTFTPHTDGGDYVVVVNAEKIKVTGNKSQDKIYHRHSGFPGGLYSSNFTQMQEKFPGRALEKAVKGMLPKGPLGYAMVKKLKIYSGDQHEHSAQQPKPLTI